MHRLFVAFGSYAPARGPISRRFLARHFLARRLLTRRSFRMAILALAGLAFQAAAPHGRPAYGPGGITERITGGDTVGGPVGDTGGALGGLSEGMMDRLMPGWPIAGASAAEPIAVGDEDWPWWRGPRHDGIARGAKRPPAVWSESENVIWKTPIPGRGHGAAIVVGQQVFLAVAEPDAQTQSVLCLDRATGQPQWSTQVHQGKFETKGNSKSTHASSTPACDGQRVYVNFLNDGAVYTTALTRAGKIVWQTRVADFVMHQGFGSSPALYDDLVIVSADNKGTGAIAALERETGKTRWRISRPKVPNYTSPIIFKLAGKDQLLLTGCDKVTSLDPLTGKTYWEIDGATTECVTSTVTDGQLIYTSGGYPRNHLSAVRADGSGKIVWENNSRVYVPSMLCHEGYLYAVLDAGVAMCWKADTGEERWKGRLGGTFSASPVLAGDTIMATNEAGKTFLFRATPERFETLGENTLGDEAFATPTVCGGRIYTRVAKQVAGKRQEFLYCLGEPAK
jgi:outer membrane protein assembly factor BamB